MFWFFGHEACGILVPRPGVEPTTPVLEGEVLTVDCQGSPFFFFPKYSLNICPGSKVLQNVVWEVPLYRASSCSFAYWSLGQAGVIILILQMWKLWFTEVWSLAQSHPTVFRVRPDSSSALSVMRLMVQNIWRAGHWRHEKTWPGSNATRRPLDQATRLK